MGIVMALETIRKTCKQTSGMRFFMTIFAARNAWMPPLMAKGAGQCTMFTGIIRQHIVKLIMT